MNATAPQPGHYLGAFERPEGYNGATTVAHLCATTDGSIYAVHPFGYYRVCFPGERLPKMYVRL